MYIVHCTLYNIQGTMVTSVWMVMELIKSLIEALYISTAMPGYKCLYWPCHLSTDRISCVLYNISLSGIIIKDKQEVMTCESGCVSGRVSVPFGSSPSPPPPPAARGRRYYSRVARLSTPAIDIDSWTTAAITRTRQRRAIFTSSLNPGAIP